MYVRSLLVDNKPDFYFVSCTLKNCLCFLSAQQTLIFNGVKGHKAAAGFDRGGPRCPPPTMSSPFMIGHMVPRSNTWNDGS